MPFRSKVQALIEELDTVDHIRNVSRTIDFKDLPEPLQKSLGFLKNNVSSVSADVRRYSLVTGLKELDTSMLNNLTQLGKNLASIHTEGNKLVVDVKKSY